MILVILQVTFRILPLILIVLACRSFAMQLTLLIFDGLITLDGLTHWNFLISMIVLTPKTFRILRTSTATMITPKIALQIVGYPCEDERVLALTQLLEVNLALVDV